MDRVVSTAELALGTVQWGMPYGIANRGGRPSRLDVAHMLDLAGAAGVSMLDTAAGYGESEELLGAMAPRPWRIVTKVGADGGDPAVAVLSQLERSQRLLRRDVLDVVLLHRAEDRTSQGGAAWRALRCARDEGRITAIGVSVYTVDEALAALDDDDVAMLQVPISIFDRRFISAGVVERARSRGCTLVARSVFLQGALFLPTMPPHLEPLEKARTRALEVAAQEGIDVRALALAFVAAFADVVLIGCETVAQLEENLMAWSQRGRLSSSALESVGEWEDLPVSVLDPSRWPRGAA